jgi:hypothetical protein
MFRLPTTVIFGFGDGFIYVLLLTGLLYRIILVI